jgi:hypothetical protein
MYYNLITEYICQTARQYLQYRNTLAAEIQYIAGLYHQLYTDHQVFVLRLDVLHIYLDKLMHQSNTDRCV